MNILEPKAKRDYDDTLKKIIFDLKFNNELPIIAGSASLASQKYYSDIDLFLSLDKMKADEVYNKLESILKNILSNDDLYFIELKLQTLKGKKYRWFYDDKFELNDFKKKFNDVDFIKLDIIARINNIFTEISIIYKFPNTKKEKIDFIENLKDDIQELKKEKKYYKILKRFFSIFKNTKNYKMLKLLSEFFNSDSGAKYQTISNLEAIKNVLSIYDDETTRKKAMFNLQELKLNNKLESIDKIIKDFNKEINKNALNMIERLKLKI
jgi:hypothetical protein